jgi:signal transduction histidine kinase
VAALGGVLLVFAVICVAGSSSGPVLLFALGFTALATYGLLRYSRKLHLLAQGAKAASGGHYGAHIAVAGGELGSIAGSINSISDGINAAVAERLKSERLKTELITNISHDIRTPLTSLITYTDLLKSEGLGAEKAPEYLEVLIQKSARLKNLTDDLFEASKAASGNIEVHVGALDLADFVRQVIGEMDERLRGSGLDFRLGLPEHAPVRADGKLLWRVMDNLLSNVLKYAMPGSRVYIDIAMEDGSYRLDVKNISEHPLNVEPSELIERFKRGDEARSGEGSGLGLSIAQSFVSSQGGRFALSIDGDLFKASVYLRAEAP